MALMIRRWNVVLLMSAWILIAPLTAAGNDDGDEEVTLNKPFQSSLRHLRHVPCVTLFHRDGRVGCSTLSRSTMTGRLLLWTSVASGENDELALDSLTAPKVPPYVAVMDDGDFTDDAVGRLIEFSAVMDSTRLQSGVFQDEEEGGVLRGILVLNSTALGDLDGAELKISPAPQSPRGDGTPSQNLAAGQTFAWNANGDGLTLRNMWGVPTVYISSGPQASYVKEVAEVQSASLSRAFAKRDDYPYVMARFNYYMGPDDATSLTCLPWIDTDDKWRPKCLPLGGNSIWAVAGSPQAVDEEAADGDQNQNQAAQDNQDGNRRLEDQVQDGDDQDGDDQDDDDSGIRPVIVVSTSIDATSMFHDASPGANSAASNILTLLLAAKLLGTSVADATLDELPRRIVFAFFQGESYGYVGSRSFFRDVAYPGFQCDKGRKVPAVAKDSSADDDGSGPRRRLGCLNPLRPDLDFLYEVGEIAGMIAVDQVGVPSTANTFYVHGAPDGDGMPAFLDELLVGLTSDDWTIESASEVDGEGDDDGNGATQVPPSPLTSLLQLSEGAVGGVVLTGFDDAFADTALYQSHLDSVQVREVDKDAIAAAATALARAAIAAAYDDGDGDSDEALEYAMEQVPNAVDASDEAFDQLYSCLFVDGECDLIKQYIDVERKNHQSSTGVDLGPGVPLGTPPNYYVGVYDRQNGQAFVKLDGHGYGSYTGEKEYGKDNADAFLIRPSALEMFIHGLLNDYFGRGSAISSTSENDDDADYFDTDALVHCEQSSDCGTVPYCATVTGDYAVCAGGKVCVCSRAHYHTALDESLQAAPNNSTGRFLVQEDNDEEGQSPIYTEPYWSLMVGVELFRDTASRHDRWALLGGFVLAVAYVWFSLAVKRTLKKQKLY